MSGGAQWRAAAHLRSDAGHDQLREQLRQAIAVRDAAKQVVDEAQAELARMLAIEADARTTLGQFAAIDGERDAARVAAIRAGRPVVDAPEITARLAAREHARTHLGDASGAVKQIRGEVGNAQIALADRQEQVEGLAAAVTAAEIERLADRLEETEKAAAALRAVVAATAGSYVSIGFVKPFPMPISERTTWLLRDPPINARPRSDNPGLRAEDARTAAAFRNHAAALLTNADAPLAAVHDRG